MANAAHPWMLTGPWYRWSTLVGPAPGVPEAGRNSKPEIQKYAGFDFAREFVNEPQRSLLWQDEDYFHRTIRNDKVAEDSIAAWLRQKTQIRKLYKPNHARNYLVVVELHCDLAGFPSVDRREVAEAGFVVRRLRVRFHDPNLPEDVAKKRNQHAKEKAQAALEQLALYRTQLAAFKNNPAKRIKAAEGWVLQRHLERPAIKKQHELLELWKEQKLALDELAAAGAFELDTQAWIPDPGSATQPADPLRGRWQTLTDATPRLDLAGESSTSLFPLIPDPRVDNHSAAGRTLFFGVIPTGGREAEADGAARFDDQHLYEIRCYVRRQPHKPGCQGELVWSEPTIGYRLASDMDPEGAGNLPISITVPSFRDLAALAGLGPTGAMGGMRIVQPPDSVMPINGTFPDVSAAPKSGIGQICFFAIILLFFIALFLVFIFLPIIVFLFQLFFLLRLKFCIPPAISIDLDLAVVLKAQLDMKIAAGASFDFAAIAAIDANLDTEAKLSNFVDLELAKVYQGELLDALKAAPLATRVQRLVDLRTDFRSSIDPELAADLEFDNPSLPPIDTEAPSLPTGAGKLAYYPYYDPREVFA